MVSTESKTHSPQTSYSIQQIIDARSDPICPRIDQTHPTYTSPLKISPDTNVEDDEMLTPVSLEELYPGYESMDFMTRNAIPLESRHAFRNFTDLRIFVEEADRAFEGGWGTGSQMIAITGFTRENLAQFDETRIRDTFPRVRVSQGGGRDNNLLLKLIDKKIVPYRYPRHTHGVWVIHIFLTRTREGIASNWAGIFKGEAGNSNGLMWTE
ncbi:hypothetical protein BD779DRAFT_1471041 [Infundibulicybe gibba]|nr:hypothetical protein BD779DRAFT_1471041 [Infundibulicybe gibba]